MDTWEFWEALDEPLIELAASSANCLQEITWIINVIIPDWNSLFAEPK